jgi:hypothetical protein
MEFIDIPTEQTSSVTDAVLAIMAVAAAIYLLQISQKARWKTTLWVCLFGLLALASVLGTIAHGFKMSISIIGSVSRSLYSGCRI